jgi:hypothetical protein
VNSTEGLGVRVLRGQQAILQSEAELCALAERSGQKEVLRDLSYYLGKPGLLKRTPVLFLVGSGRGDGIAGAVLLFEYSVARVSAGMYTSNDRSGRRTVIGPPEDRAEVVARVAEYLLGRGAHVVMLSFRSAAEPDEKWKGLCRDTPRSSWVARERNIPDFLPLGSTLDETLASIGKRTRTHMRYYRRKAEAELGCVFETCPEIAVPDVLAFNRKCMYAVPDELALWRVRALQQFENPVLVGLRDGAGEWLSLLGGRRLHGDMEVFWQMNRRDLPGHSLSLVMRTCLIEDEVKRGTERLFLDGGSSHSLCHSFAKATVTDVAVFRRTPMAFLARKLARQLIPWDNELAHLLVDEGSDSAGHEGGRPAPLAGGHPGRTQPPMEQF